MPNAPQPALEFLKENPGTANHFQAKYGYLPEGFELPEAPAPAVQFLAENPATAPHFKQKYGYLPAPAEAIDFLRANPGTEEQFKAKFGYLPKLDPTGGERAEAAVKDFTAGLLRLARSIPTAVIESASRAQKRSVSPQRPLVSAEGIVGYQPPVVQDEYSDIERLLPEQALPDLQRSAEQVEADFDGTITAIKESLPSAIKSARSGPIATTDAEGKVDVKWENINIDVLSQLAAESIAYGGGVFKLASVLGGGATAAGAANSLLISAETVHDTRQKIMAKLEKQGIRGEEAQVLANKATERAVQIIAPVAFVTGKFGEGAAINTRSLQQVGTAAARGAGSEVVEEVTQTAAPAIATGEAPKSEELAAAAVLAPIAGGVQAGTISAAAAWDAQLKEKLAEPVTEGREADTGKPASGEERRAEPTEGPRERRQPENQAKREEGNDLLRQYRALLADEEAGVAPAGSANAVAEKAIQLLYKDDLTGLDNFRAFEEYMQRNPDYQVMSMDLDDFKGINTKYGHAGGDQVLLEVGKVLAQKGQEFNVVPFRISKSGKGDEFVAAGASPDVLKAYGKAVQETLDSTTLEITNEKGERVVHPSIGASYGVGKDEGSAELALKADKDARKAAGKRQGVRDAPAASAANMAAPDGVPAEGSTDRGDLYEQIGSDLGGVSHMQPLLAKAARVFDEKGSEAGMVALEQMLNEDAARTTNNGDRPWQSDPDLVWKFVNEFGVEIQRRLEGRVEGEPVNDQATADEIANARPRQSTATVDSTLYGGIPLDRISDAAANAARKAVDALGVPDDEVDIGKPVREGQPGIGSAFVSPTTLIKKYPKLGKYVAWARKAFETQEGLRNAFRNRLNKIDEILTGGDTFGRLSDTYQKNKKTLADIRWTEDALGKSLTAKQMKDDFGATPEVIKAHTLMRAAYDHALTMANKVRELRGKLPVNRREGYVPHFFHNFFVIQENPLPAGAAGPPHSEIVGSGRTLAEATAMANQLVREGKKGVKIRQKQFKFPGEQQQAAVVGDMDYFRVQRQIQDELTLTPKEAEELLDGIIRRKGRSRFVGNFFERKGVKGFEKDLEWIDRHYFNMIARYVALDPFKKNAITAFERDKFGKFDNEHRGLAKVVKDYVNDINGVPTAVEELINSTLDQMPGFKHFLGRYLGDRPALQVASGVANATAILKLGLYNAATALVNGSQMIGANALLGTRYTGVGMRRAMAALAGKSPTDKGILKQAGVDTDLGLEAASGYSKTSQMGSLFQASTYFFSTVEKYVRATTVLGAYHKARAGGAGHQEALDFAKNVNRRVNFDYSIVDAPNFIRRSGPVGTVLFQFKKYPVKMLEFMASLKGAEAARFWIPIFLLAGYHAVPGMEALKELIKHTFGGLDMELELKRYLMDWAGSDPEKKAIAKTIMYGAFSHNPTAVDISQRIGGGDFIPSRASDLFGPSFSAAVRAAQMASEENWPEALRSIATAPGNIWVALEQDKFARSADDRGRPVAEVGPGDILKKAMGFRPTEESIQTDVKRVINYETDRYRKLQVEVVDKIINTALEYGQTIDALKQVPPSARVRAMKEAEEKRQAEMADIMETMRDHGLVVTPEQIENEVKNKNLTRSQRAFLNASDMIKARTSKIYRFAQGSGNAEE